MRPSGPSPARPPVRPVALAGLLMVLLACATIVSVSTVPAPVTVVLAGTALGVRPLVVLYHRGLVRRLRRGIR